MNLKARGFTEFTSLTLPLHHYRQGKLVLVLSPNFHVYWDDHCNILILRIRSSTNKNTGSYSGHGVTISGFHHAGHLHPHSCTILVTLISSKHFAIIKTKLKMKILKYWNNSHKFGQNTTFLKRHLLNQNYILYLY